MKNKFIYQDRAYPLYFTGIIISIYFSFFCLFPKVAASDPWQSTDTFINSILWRSNQILTLSINYLTLSEPSTGEVIKQEKLREPIEQEFFTITAWMEWSDRTIIAVYNQAVYLYKDDWTYSNINEISDQIWTKNKFTLIPIDSSGAYLLAFITKDTKEGYLGWYNKWSKKKSITESDISSAEQVACAVFKDNYYLCCYLVPRDFIQCVLYNDKLSKVSSIWDDHGKYATNDVTSMKLKQHSTNEYLMCTLGYNQQIICNQITILDSFEISFGTSQQIIFKEVKYYGTDQNYSLEKIGTSEYLVSFSSGVDIYSQKIDFDLNKIGRSVRFSQISYNNTFTILWFNSDYLLVYDRNGFGFYIRWEEFASCSNYCLSTQLATSSTLSFSAAISSSTIWFNSLNMNGSFIIVGSSQNVDINQEYEILSTLFEYVGGDSLGEDRFTFTAIGSSSTSEICEGVIYNGISSHCNCTDFFFQYEGDCWDKCYDYLYTDSLTKQCVNCKTQNKYWYEGKCVDITDVPEGFFVSDDDYNLISPCGSPCKTCEIFEDNCLTYLPCQDDEYRDVNTKSCEKCHSSCGKCTMGGTDAATNCNTCAPGYISYNFNQTQCYKECNDSSKERWYIDANQNVICVSQTSCPSKYPYYVPQTNQCVDSCSKSSNCLYCDSHPSDWYIFANKCVSSCPNNTTLNSETGICERKTQAEIIESEEDKKDIMDSIYKNITDYLDKEKDVIIVGDDYTVEVTDSNSTFNKINLGKCENILREYYKIPYDQNLFVVKLSLHREEQWTNQVEYMIYTHLGELVDLHLCEDVKITIKYPINEPNDLDMSLIEDYWDKGIDVFDSTSEFFNDICYPFTDDKGKDITITDRQKDIYQNISWCEENCTYVEFNVTDSSVECECSIKEEVNTETKANAINKDFFIDSWNNIIDELNFEIWKCYQLLRDWDNLKENIGFWIFSFLMLLHVPLLVWMGLSGYKPIKINLIFQREGNLCCPPKQNKRYTNETEGSYCLSKIEEIEGHEQEAYHIKNQGNYTYRHDIPNHTGYNHNKHSIKRQINVDEKQIVTDPTYQDTSPVDLENKNEKSFDTSIVFDRNNAHWKDTFFEQGLNNQHKLEENIFNKKTNSSFNKNGYRNQPRRESLTYHIHRKNKKTTDSFDNRVSKDQLIITSNQNLEESLDEENQKEYENENAETDSAIKIMNNHKGNRYKNEVKKGIKGDSVCLTNGRKKKHLTLMGLEIKEFTTKNPLSYSRKLSRKNYAIVNSERSRPLTMLRTNTIKENAGRQANKIPTFSTVSSMEIRKLKTMKPKSTISQQWKINTLTQTKTNINTTEGLNNMKPSNDFLDDFTMEEANMYDTRTFCMRYYVCLKAKQGILQTFIFKSPFELKVIRIIMFMFTNCLELAFNTVFYTDSMVSNSYHYNGSVGFLFNLQNSIIVTVLSNIASWIWTSLWIFLSNSSDSLKMLYNTSKEKQVNYYNWVKNALRCLTIKLTIYIIIEIAFMLFFWYYITLFCIVFKNSQISWWQAGLMSLLLGNAIPFGVSLLIVFWRDFAIKRKWDKLYRWSWWLYRL